MKEPDPWVSRRWSRAASFKAHTAGENGARAFVIFTSILIGLMRLSRTSDGLSYVLPRPRGSSPGVRGIISTAQWLRSRLSRGTASSRIVNAHNHIVCEWPTTCLPFLPVCLDLPRWRRAPAGGF